MRIDRSPSPPLLIGIPADHDEVEVRSVLPSIAGRPHVADLVSPLEKLPFVERRGVETKRKSPAEPKAGF